MFDPLGTLMAGEKQDSQEQRPHKPGRGAPTLHVVATAHLDTQWRWTIQDTINRHLPETLRRNFALFRKFPNYRFSFEGAWRYMLAKECHPELYAELKEWIAAGRWWPCGSAIDAGDTNTVSPESLLRQVLYANGFFRREFGRTSRDLFLPDCFGFSWVLPSIAYHCGLKGFSTSKLEWGSSAGIPFNVGFWRGVDGNGIVATINPGQYPTPITRTLHDDPQWIERLHANGERSGLFADLKYFGVGDTGGAPNEESVRLLEESIAAGGPIRVLSAGADELASSLSPEQIAALPQYSGELLLIEHGVGSYTAMGIMKRLNRKNEMLGDAAERAAVIADWLGGARYPREKLTQAWVRVLANQMHDILPGTCIPEAYRFAVNDEAVSLNQFAAVLADSVGAAASTLDTTTEGEPLIVYNPLAIERCDVVRARVYFPGKLPRHVRVFGPDGEEVPSQELERGEEWIDVLFQTTVPSMGFAVYEVRSAQSAPPIGKALRASRNSIENEHYLVRFDASGHIGGITDKRNGRELLAAPHVLQMLDHAPKEWPAWTIEHGQISRPPRRIVDKLIRGIRAIEHGPVRASVLIEWWVDGSRFAQTVSLTRGEPQVDIETEITWCTPATLLKAAFPLAASNPRAVYDLGLGTIERGNNHERLHEVPAQQWAAIDDRSGEFGTAIFSDCKYGWDKPADNTLRLTLLHTPGPAGFHCLLGGAGWDDDFAEQQQLDFGNHRLAYAIAGYEGTWREGDVVNRAARFNQPLRVFQTIKRKGPFGRSYSFLRASSPHVAIQAVKLAEESDEIVVRVHETAGRQQDSVAIECGDGIASARETSGVEETIGDATLHGGALRFSIAPYGLRTFAIRPDRSRVTLAPPVCKPVDLPYNLDGISTNDNRMDGDFDGAGNSLPSELLPPEVVSEGITFRIGPRGFREKNVVACRGQVIRLPRGTWNGLYLLAAAVGQDVPDSVAVGEQSYDVLFPCYDEPLGQWEDGGAHGLYQTAPGDHDAAYLWPQQLGWVGTHRHSRASCADEAAIYCSLFKYFFVLPRGCRTVRLPYDRRVRVVAATVARSNNDLTMPAWPLVEELGPPPPTSIWEALLND